MISSPSRQEVTQVLIDWSGGDLAAAERLMPLIYDELRRMRAATSRREARPHLAGDRAGA